MNNPASIKLPLICFLLLSLTLLLGGLGTLGGFVLLYFYEPQSSGTGATFTLALNGVLCWTLAIACVLSAWRLFRRMAKAEKLAPVTWWLVAGFTVWIVCFDGMQGWSPGGIAEITLWGVLEILIGIWLILARGRLEVR
jgi:hypothetical protein